MDLHSARRGIRTVQERRFRGQHNQSCSGIRDFQGADVAGSRDGD